MSRLMFTRHTNATCTQLNLTGKKIFFCFVVSTSGEKKIRRSEMVWKAQKPHRESHEHLQARLFFLHNRRWWGGGKKAERTRKRNFSLVYDERQTTDGAELFKCIKLGQKFQNLPSQRGAVQRTRLLFFLFASKLFS